MDFPDIYESDDVVASPVAAPQPPPIPSNKFSNLL